jgi:hypothetical protein
MTVSRERGVESSSPPRSISDVERLAQYTVSECEKQRTSPDLAADEDRVDGRLVFVLVRGSANSFRQADGEALDAREHRARRIGFAKAWRQRAPDAFLRFVERLHRWPEC